MAEEKVAAAAGTAAAGEGNIGQEIEQAMAAATVKAAGEGVTDPEKIREAKLNARDEVINKHAKLAAEKAAKEKEKAEAVYQASGEPVPTDKK